MPFFLGMLTMLGLVAAAWLLWRLAGWAQRPARYRLAIVLPVKGQVENLEQLMRYAAYAAREQRFGPLVIADYGMEAETRTLCRRLCIELGAVLAPAGELAAAVQVEPGTGIVYTK